MTKEEIMRLAEFDYDKKYWEQFKDSSQEDVSNGAQQENARLLPLIEALAESNEKLKDALNYWMGDGLFNSEREKFARNNTMSVLAAHAERMERFK